MEPALIRPRQEAIDHDDLMVHEWRLGGAPDHQPAGHGVHAVGRLAADRGQEMLGGQPAHVLKAHVDIRCAEGLTPVTPPGASPRQGPQRPNHQATPEARA